MKFGPTVQLAGNVVSDPVLRHTSSGTPVVNVTLAVNFQTKQGGSYQDTVQFWKVTAWQHTANYVARNAGKGSAIVVEGRITGDTYESNNGGLVSVPHSYQANDQNRTEWTMTTDSVKILKKVQPSGASAGSYTSPEDDEIPF